MNPVKSIFLALLLEGTGPFRFHHSLGVSALPDGTHDATEDAPFVVAGYFPDWRKDMDLNATALHLTDLMLFSLMPEAVPGYDPEKFFGPSQFYKGENCCLFSDHYDVARKAKAYKKEQQPDKQELRTLVTLGGDMRSQAFGKLVFGKEEGQDHFLEALVQLCRDEDLDGVDINYSNFLSDTEWSYFLKFIPKAAQYLHRHGLLLTVAVMPRWYLPSEVCKEVDRVHVMSYDMNPSPQAPGKNPTYGASVDSVKKVLMTYEKGSGCPASKLIVGIPAFARYSLENVHIKPYQLMVDEMMHHINDDPSNGPPREYLQSKQTWDGYEFESPDDVQEKTKFAVENGFGGAFIWELGQDKQMEGVAKGGILLEAIASSAETYGAGMAKGGQGEGGEHEEL